MTLEDLGYNDQFEKFRIEEGLSNFEVGRVISEHKERYIIRTVQGELEAEITGNLRFSAKGRQDYPAVGDWVAFAKHDSNIAIIHRVFPRNSIIKRQAVGQYGEIQIIATNVDCAFIVQAVDRDLNINRLERYLTICNNSKVLPVIVLSKIDLINDSQLDEILERIKERIKNVSIVTISNETNSGYEKLNTYIGKGKTYCLLGSSGVGKSTLLNKLCGNTRMKTDTISLSTNKGRHVTSHRELIVLENGGLLIDNPGMREVGIADADSGLGITFDKIVKLSQNCRFKDCTHIHEAGCAVIEAVEAGEIDSASYMNYLKMKREKNHFESTIAEKRKKDRDFGKMVKHYKKEIKGHK